MALRLSLFVATVLIALAVDLGSARAATTQDAIAKCQELLPAFEPAPHGITITVQPQTAEQPTGIRIDWTAPQSKITEGWIICWFLTRESADEPWQLHQLETSDYGLMRRYDIQQLYKLLYIQNRPLQDFSAQQRTPLAIALYILQQTINGISLGCLYGLLALAFTLIFSITRSINIAFGDLYMIGAFIVLLGDAAVGWLFGGTGALALLLLLLFAAATGGAYGYAIDRLAFRPLRNSSPTMILIASIGVAFALKEAVRLLQGPKTRYLLIEQMDSIPLITGAGFDVYATRGHLLAIAATIAIAAALGWLLGRTDFGRSQRACAQDPQMAALLGVRRERVIGLCFVIAGALAAAAGYFAGVQYGVINFHMGTLMGFKALTAAVLGGIGSPKGALIGGLVVALAETYAAALVGSEWEDMAVFSLLVAVLVFRPTGLVGWRTTPEERMGA